MKTINTATDGEVMTAGAGNPVTLDASRPIIALVSEQDALIEALATALPGFEIISKPEMPSKGLGWSSVDAIIVDLDTIDMADQLSLHNEATATGFAGDSYAVGKAADPALDRHLKLLSQPGLFVHSDETDMAILNVTLKRGIQRQRQADEIARPKRAGIAGTAREIAGLIKAWNTRLAHERGTEEQQR
ncbi:MAG: hypothetical protein KI792_04775 [Alphaproteobacteria bacterium]|nr:hypothetical protein [Alphaproteobacteria bacterium SS10]